jgi:nucleoside-diphosphate kinase
MERTLAILKPDCVQRNLIGEVTRRIECAGFKIVRMKMLHLTRPMAEGFYEVHKGKSFYTELVNFMTKGPCVVAVLAKENCVEAWRKAMGATDPEKAEQGTIRRDLAENIRRNIVHGSDSPENAEREINFFFSRCELL